MKYLLNIAYFSSLSVLCGCFVTVNPPTADSSASSSSTGSPSAEATSEDATPRETLNKTTQNVLNLDQALMDGGVLASTKVEVADPLTQSASAYRTTVGKLGAMAIHQAIQIRNAQSIDDPKPLSYDVFVKEIIKKGEPDGIQLAMLPYYQEYAWDKKGQVLVVVDFPARKEERRKQLDSN